MAHFITANGSRISNSIQHGSVGADLKIGVGYFTADASAYAEGMRTWRRKIQGA